MDELDRERPGVDLVPGKDVLEVTVAEVVLVELGPGHGDRQPAPVHDRRLGSTEFAQDPGQCPDVVLVPMRDHDRLDVVGALAQVAEVRKHEIDAEHVRGREAQPGVHDDDPAVVLDDRHVLPDFPEPTERQDP